MDYTQYYLGEFKKYISLQTASPNTIKNYLSDLRLFLFFITQNQRLPLDPQTLASYINQDFLIRYEQFLSITNPPTTTKRRLSSLKKFIDYCGTQGILPAPIASVAPSVSAPELRPSFPPQMYYQEPTPIIPVTPPVAYAPIPTQPDPTIQPTQYNSAPAVNFPPQVESVPDPQRLVHNFVDLDPIPTQNYVPPTIIPQEEPNQELKPLAMPVTIAISAISLIVGFTLTLLVNFLLTK